MLKQLLYTGNPEQITLMEYIETTFSPSAMVPLVFAGNIAGSEFLTYAATKLYLCFKITLFKPVGVVPVANLPVVSFHDETNTSVSNFQNNQVFHNVTAGADYGWTPHTEIKNLYFSRFLYTVYTQMFFIGYRLTY